MKTVLLVMLCVLFAPFLAPYDPGRSVGLPWQEPDALFWCGTDALGRDVLSSALHCGVAMLLFSLMATVAASIARACHGVDAVDVARSRIFIDGTVRQYPDVAAVIDRDDDLLRTLTLTPNAVIRHHTA
ncbi:hypothetical protein [Candidatus Symbiopectobacterium sp.]|uniref:hypothetical protein n=1 Tax=Candidatus Symbiopectobacterium sp. TaxID=2816440 RepID=UPI0025BA9F28|nr:hypothetical protein [Candidatus Symbiopectobacterium sp.]